MRQKLTAKRRAKQTTLEGPVSLSFMSHVRELKRRLFWVALSFVIITGAVFPFYEHIIEFLMYPLGGEKLYYLSPVGGLGFVIKICMDVGIFLSIPIIIYHLYEFIVPAMPKHGSKQVVRYVTISLLLAVIGILFVYLISLPSALHFLTTFNLGNVTAMLTVDEYTAFVVTYLLSGAALFQLPLIMVIVDSVKPMPPKMWNKYQRHMIVAAFVIALLITPSPNIIDQFILALPVLVMYQIGILLVWLRRRPQVGTQGKEKTILKAEQQRPVIVHPTSVPATKPVIAQSMVVAQQAARSVQNMSTSQNQIRPQTMDGIVAMRAPRIQPRKLIVASRVAAPEFRKVTSVRGLDGFYLPVRS